MKTVEEALKSLPQDAESIAAFLEAQGVRGQRLTLGTGPLACWLQRECGTLNVLIGPQVVVWALDGVVQRTLLPEPVLDFLDHWDRGAYPQLSEVES